MTLSLKSSIEKRERLEAEAARIQDEIIKGLMEAIPEVLRQFVFAQLFIKHGMRDRAEGMKRFVDELVSNSREGLYYRWGIDPHDFGTARSRNGFTNRTDVEVKIEMLRQAWPEIRIDVFDGLSDDPSFIHVGLVAKGFYTEKSS